MGALIDRNLQDVRATPTTDKSVSDVFRKQSHSQL